MQRVATLRMDNLGAKLYMGIVLISRVARGYKYAKFIIDEQTYIWCVTNATVVVEGALINEFCRPSNKFPYIKTLQTLWSWRPI